MTLFFSEDYFRSFLPRANEARTAFDGGWAESGLADPSEIEKLIPPAPEGLMLQGVFWLRLFEDGWDVPVKRVTWVWSYARR